MRSYMTTYYGTGFATKEGDSTATAIYLHMQQENKYFKEQLKTYRGEYKQAPIDRITKTESAVNIILSNHDSSLSTTKPASQGTDPVSSRMNSFTYKCIYILQLD